MVVVLNKVAVVHLRRLAGLLRLAAALGARLVAHDGARNHVRVGFAARHRHDAVLRQREGAHQPLREVGGTCSCDGEGGHLDAAEGGVGNAHGDLREREGI